MNDVIVRVIDLPSWQVGGCVRVDEEGDFNLYVNSRYGYRGQIRALEHELEHIRGNDFWNGMPVSECEKRARKAAGE